MKKITLFTVLIIWILAVKVFASSFDITLKSKTTVEQGETFDFVIGFADITGDGVTTAVGKIEYDKNIFEHVDTETDSKKEYIYLKLDNINWEGLVYNDSGNADDGKFVANTKNASSVKENHDFLTVKLRVKENATIGKTEVKVTRICSNY